MQEKIIKAKDIFVYNLALKFLKENTPVDDFEKIIEQYLIAPFNKDEHLDINTLYMRLLESAQNANMKAGVVGGSIDGVKNLKTVLFDFSPQKVFEFYGPDSIGLLEEIITKLKPRGIIRKTSQSIWPKYCKTILSAASFLSQFKNSSDFYKWANHFYYDEKSIAALPLILSEEIFGIGFPLACDFLKEIGYVNFGKPDVHIKYIFKEIGLINQNDSNYQILKAMVRIAKNVGVTTYSVDKVFWLIGSGYFYNHTNIGKNGRIGRKRDEFIAYFKKSYNL